MFSMYSTARALALAGLLALTRLSAAESGPEKSLSLDISAVDTYPRATKQAAPAYPEAMRRYGISGEVVVEMTVGPDGRVLNAAVHESASPGFDEAAIEAVLKWQFTPGIKDGKPVSTEMRVPLIFTIDRAPDRRAFAVESRSDPRKQPEGFRFDTPPELKSVHIPVYPYALRRNKVKGKAKIGMLIDASGRVVKVTELEATHPEFSKALRAAVEGFRFEPAKLNGQPVLSLLGFEQEFDSRTPADSPGDDMLSLEKRSPEKIVPLNQLDAPLKPRSRRAPRFPLDLPADVVSGSVVIECLIDSTGRVRLPRVQTATHEAFGYAAVQAAGSWWFDPPLVKGKPVVARALIPFNFAPPAPKKTKAAPKKAEAAP